MQYVPRLAPALCGVVALTSIFAVSEAGFGEPEWKKHVVRDDFSNLTAVAADFTADGKIDVVSSNPGDKTWLFVGPDWKGVVIDDDPQHGAIHSEVMDVDGDGDPDFVGARYSPGLIYWLERPEEPQSGPWPFHLVDDQVNGIHGIIRGDVDGDGRPDLIANSGQPTGTFPNSLVWYRIPEKPRSANGWERYVFADKDAPGLSHYHGVGDVDGDGRTDIASAAKGGPGAEPGTGEWFAWWQAPAEPRKTWTKHVISDKEPGATNIHPADVDNDGKTDFIASRGHGHGIVWFKGPDWKAHAICPTRKGHPKLEGPHCLAVVDMDADGDVDAATCAKDDQVVAWFENDGKGNFTTHVVGHGQSAYDIRAVDMDGDSDLDLLIAGQLSKNLVWFENP